MKDEKDLGAGRNLKKKKRKVLKVKKGNTKSLK